MPVLGLLPLRDLHAVDPGRDRRCLAADDAGAKFVPLAVPPERGPGVGQHGKGHLRIGPSSTTQRPPDVFLLGTLWPVLALTCQPWSVLPSKRSIQPSWDDPEGEVTAACGSAAGLTPAAITESRSRQATEGKERGMSGFSLRVAHVGWSLRSRRSCADEPPFGQPRAHGGWLLTGQMQLLETRREKLRRLFLSRFAPACWPLLRILPSLAADPRRQQRGF